MYIAFVAIKNQTEQTKVEREIFLVLSQQLTHHITFPLTVNEIQNNGKSVRTHKSAASQPAKQPAMQSDLK